MGAPTASAQIYIGGPIRGQDILTKFIELAENEKEFTSDAADLIIDKALKDGEPFYLSNSDARYGEFTDLEEFCQENKLSYVRYTGSDGGDITPMVQWWVPGMEKPVYRATSSEGDVTVPLISLQQIFAAVEEVCSKELPKALPQLLRSESWGVPEFAKDTLERGGVPNPYEYLKQWVTDKYPVIHQDDLPLFKVEV